MAFAPVDLLPGVVAAGWGADGVGDLDRLGVMTPAEATGTHPSTSRSRLRNASWTRSMLQSSGHRGKCQYTGPPLRQIMREMMPRATGAQNVEDGVNHLAAGMLLVTARQVRSGTDQFDEPPLGSREIGGFSVHNSAQPT